MEYIRIGKIVNTHGIKGELKIQSCSDFDAERYQKGNTVYIAYEGQYVPFQVASFRTAKGFTFASFENVQDINAVEKYKECMIYMNASDRRPLKDGEYFRDQLVGLEVFDEEDHRIGIVAAVEETFSTQRHLRIINETGAEILVPYVPHFIRSVDLDQKKIVIHKEEGLL